MLLIQRAELHGYRGEPRVVDVRCRDGIITEIATQLAPGPGEELLDARHGALLPGLHDHHLHVFGLAAAENSVDCGPERLSGRGELQRALRAAPGDNWIRAVNYHESVAGDLDRWQLDQLMAHRPLRLQHRSGILWTLNSKAIEHLELDDENPEGLERDARGQLTGRLFRLDHFLRKRLGAVAAPDLGKLSQRLARYGITGVTDTGAHNDAKTLQQFEQQIKSGQFCQRLVLMGKDDLPESSLPGIHRGALKILLDEFQLPDGHELVTRIRRAHAQGRPVAFHCVTESQLVFALSMLQDAGPRTGDRIEHASLCPDEVLPLLKATDVSVVTQPGLLYTRGRQYQSDVRSSQHPLLYRCQTLIRAGIPLALSSDAPYGDINPWRNMQTATERCNADAYCFGPAEALSPEEALQGYLRDPQDLRQTRIVSVGGEADLCLLDRPWQAARNHLSSVVVTETLIAGQRIRR